MKYGTCEWKITLKLLDNHLTGESLNRQSAAEFRGAGQSERAEGGREGGREVGEEASVVGVKEGIRQN